MAIYLLKRSYQLKNLQEVDFKDLWSDHGIFTTMWIFGKPPKILFFENHIENLIRSLQAYRIKKKSLKKDILKIINISKSKSAKIVTTSKDYTKIPDDLKKYITVIQINVNFEKELLLNFINKKIDFNV